MVMIWLAPAAMPPMFQVASPPFVQMLHPLLSGSASLE